MIFTRNCGIIYSMWESICWRRCYRSIIIFIFRGNMSTWMWNIKEMRYLEAEEEVFHHLDNMRIVTRVEKNLRLFLTHFQSIEILEVHPNIYWACRVSVDHTRLPSVSSDDDWEHDEGYDLTLLSISTSSSSSLFKQQHLQQMQTRTVIIINKSTSTIAAYINRV